MTATKTQNERTVQGFPYMAKIMETKEGDKVMRVDIIEMTISRLSGASQSRLEAKISEVPIQIKDRLYADYGPNLPPIWYEGRLV